MKNGKTLQELSTTILEQATAKKDYLADTRKLRFTDDARISFEVGTDTRLYSPTKLCLEQIGQRVGIPRSYVDRMASDAPQLLARNVNHWFDANPERRMLRTFDNGEKIARAFLSDKYRPLDNFDLATSIIPKLRAVNCEVHSSEITEKRLYIQASTPRLEGLIAQRKAEGTQHRIGEINDIVQAGIVISNSEVGCGAVKVEPMIYRLVCRNGLIQAGAMRKHHVGRAGEGGIEGDEALEMFSDETRRLDDRAFWSKVCDVVDASLNKIRFDATVAKMNEAAGEKIGKPSHVIEVIENKFGLAKNECESVLEHLANGGDLSKWGLVNAVTRSAEDASDYDRAIELERIGGQVLEMSAQSFLN